MIGAAVKPSQQTVHIDTGGISKPTRVNPGSIAVIGKSPYINEETGTWFVYDQTKRMFVDTGVPASSLIKNVSDDFSVDGGTLSLNSENTIEELGLGLSSYEAITNLFN